MAYIIRATQGKGTTIRHMSKAKTRKGAMQAFKRKFSSAKISSVKGTRKPKPKLRRRGIL